MRGKTDYLFQRPGSSNWWIKLQSPGKRIEKSLRTRDKKEAEIKASPLINQHKTALLDARPRIETVWRYEYQPSPDMQDATNGERVLASATELKFYGPDGKLLRTAANGGPASQIENLERRLGISFPVPIELTDEAKARAKPKTDDDQVLETYITHRK